MMSAQNENAALYNLIITTTICLPRSNHETDLLFHLSGSLIAYQWTLPSITQGCNIELMILVRLFKNPSERVSQCLHCSQPLRPPPALAAVQCRTFLGRLPTVAVASARTLEFPFRFV